MVRRGKVSPDVIVHLAAQAGLRYSLETPHAYFESNVLGTLNVLEAARKLEVRHLLMASTSSVYGANTEMPISETEKADAQLPIYVAKENVERQPSCPVATATLANGTSPMWTTLCVVSGS